MDRTVPKSGNDDIELYMRTYYSLLRSTHTIQIETLVEAHMAMESSLHVHSRDLEPDVAALTYSSLRLPKAMPQVDFVVLGQVEKSFTNAGYDVNDWERVTAPARRRRMHFDGGHRLAAFVVSRSDIDDLIPMLTAYQIEWNKLHAMLQAEMPRLFLERYRERHTPLTYNETEELAPILRMSADDVMRLEQVWGSHFFPTLHRIAAGRKQLGLRLIASSLADYRRATAYWWDTIYQHTRHVADTSEELLDLEDRPVYFVSSNTHSLTNLLTGFALRHEQSVIDYIEAKGHESLLAEYHDIVETEMNDPEAVPDVETSHARYVSARARNAKANFLYYALKKYLADTPQPRNQSALDEREIGIVRIPSKHGIDIETQVIELRRLRPDWLDPRVKASSDFSWLAHSDALIVNIDYPLGLGAYEILARLSERVTRLLGVYVMGKAATLNGRIGDVMIPSVVHDEHSRNTYMFSNCFSAQDVAPYMAVGQVMDNQKAITTPGTFLQNQQFMSVFYKEGYTIIEMEAGPYLSSIYEAVRPKRHPENEIVTLHGAPFDVGFLHYASDTPFTKGHNLGVSNLSYAGIEPTYATAIAILQQIFMREADRVRARQSEPAARVASPGY